MDDDIREDMESGISYYKGEIDQLRKITVKSVQDVYCGRDSTNRHLLDQYCLSHYMKEDDANALESKIDDKIGELRGKIERARELAAKKQRERDIDKAQSEAYDQWRRSG